MIGEVLAGAALIKSSVSAIKGAIGTAQDVGEIAGFIDQVFLGQQQVKKAQQEGNSLNSVAKDMIDAQKHITHHKERTKHYAAPIVDLEEIINIYQNNS